MKLRSKTPNKNVSSNVFLAKLDLSVGETIISTVASVILLSWGKGIVN